MGIFGRKREMNNAAAVSIPNGPRPVIQPGPTTIHNHGISWAAIIATAFFCALLLLPVGWFALVFLFDKMGAADPESEAAFWVVIFPALFIIGWLVKWFLLALMDSGFSFWVDLEKEKTERERVKLLAAQTTLEPGRMTQEDYKFGQIILGVMMQAFNETSGQPIKFKGRARPWSIDGVLAVAKVAGISVSETKAGTVSKWLRTHDVLQGALEGQVNAAQFDNLSRVRALLDKEFGKPIAYTPHSLRSNAGYKFVE